jgi:hypothetical protein
MTVTRGRLIGWALALLGVLAVHAAYAVLTSSAPAWLFVGWMDGPDGSQRFGWMWLGTFLLDVLAVLTLLPVIVFGFRLWLRIADES